ncbi:MAG: hypothetical protein N2645_09345 [Clostridia bacterium]|nr:hypothetical protein [Clostridia bacterium]
MILEGLALKGLIVLGKYIVSHGLMAKVGILLSKYVIAHGVAATISAVVAAGTMVGLITWTGERIKMLSDGVEALSNGDVKKAAKSFGRLAISTNLNVHSLADQVHQCVLEKGISLTDSQNIKDAILCIKDDIEEEIAKVSGKAG